MPLTLINHETIAIQPIFEGPNRSIITTLHGVYEAPESPAQLINLKCLQFGSTLKGRQDAATYKLKSYKSPVIVDPKSFGFFPTISPSSPDCIWISQIPFDSIVDHAAKHCTITYNANLSIDVNTSGWTVSRQLDRLRILLYAP